MHAEAQHAAPPSAAAPALALDVSRDAVAEDRRDNGRPHDGPSGPNEPGRERARHVAHVALERASMTIDGRDTPLAPGMAVTAEIKTGRRRVISYLLSPLQQYAHEGMTER